MCSRQKSQCEQRQEGAWLIERTVIKPLWLVGVECIWALNAICIYTQNVFFFFLMWPKQTLFLGHKSPMEKSTYCIPQVLRGVQDQ